MVLHFGWNYGVHLLVIVSGFARSRWEDESGRLVGLS